MRQGLTGWSVLFAEASRRAPREGGRFGYRVPKAALLRELQVHRIPRVEGDGGGTGFCNVSNVRSRASCASVHADSHEAPGGGKTHMC